MENKEKSFVSAVVYIHDAEERVDGFLKSIISIMERNFEHMEVICVNDASKQKCVERIKEASKAATTASISLLNMSSFHGVEAAMTAGLDLAIGDFVFEFDTTVLDFEEKDVMEVYHRMLQGYDIVSASSNRSERKTSKLFYKIFKCFSDSKQQLHTENFRVLSRRSINRIRSMNRTVPYRKAIYAECGLKMDTVRYIPSHNPEMPKNSQEERYKANLAVESLLLFTKIGYRISFLMTLIMIFVSLFMLSYSVVIYITAHPVAGWTTTILFLSIAFMALFGTLTIIIKYLQLLMRLTLKTKYYNFESIEKLTR